MQKIKTLHSSEFIKDGVEHNKNHEVPNIGDTFVHEERANVVKQFNVSDEGIVYLYDKKSDIKRGTNTKASWGKFGFITESVQRQSPKQQIAKQIANDNNVTRPRSITYRRTW
jgi:hypothetical protein